MISLATINGHAGNVRKYEESRNMDRDRKDIFQIISNSQITEQNKAFKGYKNSLEKPLQEGNEYTVKQLKEKNNRLKNSVKDGYVYFYDTEVLGVAEGIEMNIPNHPRVDSSTRKAIERVSRENHIMTEFYMSRQLYKNGKAVGETEKVFSFTNTRSLDSMEILVDSAKTMPGADALGFNLSRIAGAADPGTYPYFGPDRHNPRFWNANANNLDEEILDKGMLNIFNNAEFKLGVSEAEDKKFRAQAQKVYDMFNQILDSDNSIIETLNGDAFDTHVIFNYFKQAGIEVTDEFKEKFERGHLDVQKAMGQTMKGEIFTDIIETKKKLEEEAKQAFRQGREEHGEALMKQADKLDLAMTGESIVAGANAHGANIKYGDAHVAAEDVTMSQKAMKYYHQRLIENIDNIGTEIFEGDSDKYLYKANKAIMFDKEKDLFYSTSIGDDANSYNPVGMEAGHTYKLKMYNIEDFKLPENISAKQRANMERLIEENKGKKLLQMEDQYRPFKGDIVRSSWLVIDSVDDIQEKILDKGNIEISKKTRSSQKLINEATKAAIKDSARREKDMWTSLNSDKGFESFEKYHDIYKEYVNFMGEDATKANLGKLLEENADSLKEHMPSLFPKGGPNSDHIIIERAMYFNEMFDDLDKNKDMYQMIRNKVNHQIGSIEQFKKKINFDGDSNSYVLKREYRNAKTAAFSQVQQTIKDELINGATDEQLIKNHYKVNYNKETEQSIKEIMEQTGKSEIQVRTGLFEKIFGEKFDRNSESIKRSAFGYKKRNFDSTTINQLDILGVDGEYTKINTTDMRNVETDLYRKLNSIKSNPKAPSSVKTKRNSYINNIAKDLNARKLISDDDLEFFMNSSKPYQKATLLSGMILDTRTDFENYISQATKAKDTASLIEKINKLDIDHNGISKEKSEFINNYLKNVHMNSIYANNGVETFLNRRQNKVVKKLLEKKGFDKLISKVIDDTIPRVFTFSADAEAYADDIKKLMMERFNYTESNADLFINNVINNKNNYNFKYLNGKDTGGITNMIKEIDGQGYLITTTRDRHQSLENMLNKADKIDMDEVKKRAMVFKLDKVTEENGIRVIRRSNASAIAVTKDFVAIKGNKGESMTYSLRDTVDQAMADLRYKYERGLEAMATGDYEKANSRINAARNKINENKALNGTVVTYVNKDVGYLKRQKNSIADYILKDKVNISDMIYTLDTVLKNDTLRDSLVSHTNEYSVKRLEKNIEDFKNNSNGRKLKFENLEFGTKMWFARNIKDISGTLLENENFMRNNEGMEELLKTLQKHGSSVFLTKESGEANKGYINLVPTHAYVAGSHYSGASRPLINQILSSKAITENDMIMAAKEHFGVDMNMEQLQKEFGFKTSRKFITDEALKVQQQAAAKGEHLAFSTKMRYMNAEEFKMSINDVINSNGSEEWIMNLKNKLKDKHGDISLDEIKSITEAIGLSTSIYEDSGAIDPKLARLLEKKTVTVKTLNEDDDIQEWAEKWKKGEDIFTDGKKIIGVDVENNQLTLQNNSNYFDVKIGIGSGEKGEYHTPQFRGTAKEIDRQVDIAHEIFQHISGGANLIGNPNYGKHEAFGSMITMYTNAITNNIENDEQMNQVNTLLNKHFGEYHPHEIQKIDGDYILVEHARNLDKPFDGLKAYDNFIDEFRNDNNDFMKRIHQDIKNIENKKARIGWVDVATMSDNTMEKAYDIIDGIGQDGAKINYRSNQVLGAFIGNDREEMLGKYKQIINGESHNLLKALSDADIEQMMKNDRFVENMMQASNIGAALMISSKGRDKVELELGASIKQLSITDDILPNGSTMTASELPELFTFKGDNKRVNVFEVNLEGFKIKNPEYENLKNSLTGKNKESYIAALRKSEYGQFIPTNGRVDVEDFLSKIGIKQHVDNIYIPALAPNKAGETYMLSELQKSGADLLSTVLRLKNNNYDGETREGLISKMNQQYAKYMDSLRYELTAKDGLYKKNLNIRSENSARLKVSNIEAPILTNDGQYMSNMFKNQATPLDANGKVTKYIGTQYVSAEDLFGYGKVDQSYKNVGRQLLDGNIGDETELFDFLNKKLAGGKAKNLEEILQSNKHLLDTKTYGDKLRQLGEDYFKEVGFDSVLMRDPAFISSSYNPVRTRVSDNVTKGTGVLDAVTAIRTNADGDGDEYNIYNHLFNRNKDGSVSLKTRDSKEAIALREAIEASSDANLATLRELNANYKETIAKEAERSAKDIKGYRSLTEELRAEMFKAGDIKNWDYINGDTMLANLSARFLKKSIGQISNPNYYLRSAATNYTGSRGVSDDVLRLGRNINFLSDITEQSLIDVKSIKTDDDISRISNLAETYKKNMDILGTIDNSEYALKRKIGAMSDMLLDVGGLLASSNKLNLDGESMIKFANDKILTDDTARFELAKDIISGNYKRGDSKFVTVEEILGDTYKVLQDLESNQIFWDPTVRQTNLTRVGNDALVDILKTDRALSAIGLGEEVKGRGAMFQAANAKRFLRNSATIDGTYLNVGDVIFSSNTDGLIAPGIFEVTKTYRDKNGKANFEFKDLSNDKVKTKLIGDNFDEISVKLDGFSKAWKYSDEYNLENIKNKLHQNLVDSYTEKARNDLAGLRELFESPVSNIESLNNIAKTAVRNSVDYETQNHLLRTVEALNQQKLGTSGELTRLRKNMNDHIRAKGKEGYTNKLDDELFKLSGIKNERKVSRANIAKFREENLSKEKLDLAESLYFDRINKEKLQNAQRFNLDEMHNVINGKLDDIIASSPELAYSRGDMYKKVMDEFKFKDMKNREIAEDTIFKNLSNPKFKTNALNYNLKGINEQIKAGNHQKAADMLGETVIAYGKYSGMNINQLNLMQISEIISPEYLSGARNKLDQGIIQETQEIIKKVNELSKISDIIIVKPDEVAKRQFTEQMGNDFITEMRKSMNDAIKSKSRQVSNSTISSESTIAKMFNSAKTGFQNMSGGKKKLLAGAAIGAATLGLLSAGSSGKRTLDNNDKKYSELKQPVNVKMESPTPMTPNQVPKSNNRYYANQNNGLAVNISAKAPSGSSAMAGNRLLEAAFGGGNLNINSTSRDSTSQVNDYDIQNMMSDSTSY